MRKWVWFVLGIITGITYMNCRYIIGEKYEMTYKYKTLEKLSQPIYECELDEVSCMIREKAIEKGINYKIAIAIAKHETGVYTSEAFNKLNNVGGMMYWDGNKMSLMKFNTLEEGIEAFVNNLKKNYFDIGLDTIEEIQQKYCPIGINDNGLNKYWLSGVTKYYNELGGE